MYQSVGDGIEPLEQAEKRNNTKLAEVIGEILITADAIARKCFKGFNNPYIRASKRAVGCDVLYVCGLRNLKGHQVGPIRLPIVIGPKSQMRLSSSASCRRLAPVSRS